MNKAHAQAWDQVSTMAARREATLVRDGHRFFHRYSIEGHTVEVWAAENEPRFGVKVSGVAPGAMATSVRCWSIEALERVVAALTRPPASVTAGVPSASR